MENENAVARKTIRHGVARRVPCNSHVILMEQGRKRRAMKNS
jgi:hypothetical protein